MQFFKKLLLKVRTLRLQRQLDQDLHDEMAAHLALKQQALEREGRNADEAKRQSVHAFGNPAQWKESTREMWIPAWLEGIWKDLTFGTRLLLKDWLFTGTALLTLAIGIGANTAIFSMINDLMLRALPVKDPDQLAWIEITNLPPWENSGQQGKQAATSSRMFISHDLLQAMEKQDVFSGIAGHMSLGNTTLENKGELYQAFPRYVSGSYFSVLGVQPLIGRFFTSEDDISGGPQGGWPIVISESMWNRIFQRDPNILGSVLLKGSIPFTVIGIAPASFTGTSPGHETDAWIPMRALEVTYPSVPWYRQGWDQCEAVVRIRSGVTFQQASTRILNSSRVIFEGILPSMNEKYREVFLSQKIQLKPGRSGHSWLAAAYGNSLWILFGAVSAILLIAATNLTNLILTRSIARDREIAVRLAIGASAHRIRRQLMIESGILVIAGLLSGIVLAQWITPIIQRKFSLGDWVHLNMHFDWRMFGFLSFVLIFVVLISGWIPAWKTTNTKMIYRQTNESQLNRFGILLRSSLIVLQISLTVALLGGAGLLVYSLKSVFNEKTGFDASLRYLIYIDVAGTGTSNEKLLLAHQNIQENIRTLPGVQSVTWTKNPPFSGMQQTDHIYTRGRISEVANVFTHEITNDYFNVFGIPLLAGQDFPQKPSHAVCIISDNLARHLFGSPQAAIGEKIQSRTQQGKETSAEIIGVVGNAKYSNMKDNAPQTVYRHIIETQPQATLTLALRFSGSQDSLLKGITPILRRESSGRLPILKVRTEEEILHQSLASDRLLTTLLTAFSLFALIISLTGIAGLLSYTVQQRRREIGIRMALGATPSLILRQFQNFGVQLGIAGMILGGMLSYGLHRVIESYLYGIKPNDPLIWGCVALALFFSIVVAASVPAWRVTRNDPLQSLRAD